jgi:hypothetical protein
MRVVTDRPLGCGGFSSWAVAGSVTVAIITTSIPMLTKKSFPRNGIHDGYYDFYGLFGYFSPEPLVSPCRLRHLDWVPYAVR